MCADRKHHRTIRMTVAKRNKEKHEYNKNEKNEKM